MFASFSINLGEGCDFSGSGISLTMHLGRSEDNQLQLRLESSALVTSCECRIDEPEMRRFTHSTSTMQRTMPASDSMCALQPLANTSAYVSPKPVQLYVSRPGALAESQDKMAASPISTVVQPRVNLTPPGPLAPLVEPELSAVSKLAAVSSTNELTKCFQSATMRMATISEAPLPQHQPGSRSSPTSSDTDESSTDSSASHIHSRSASLPISTAVSSANPKSALNAAPDEDKEDKSSSDSSNSSVSGSIMGALLQKIAVPRQTTRPLDIRQGIDSKKQREKLEQAAHLPFEALMSSDIMSAAVSVAKQSA